MMKTITLLPFLAAIVLSGCDNNSSGYAAKEGKKAEDCIFPHNPFNDGGGHDAGFNWARENEGGCNGNSDSFNEGCEEYYRQMDEYNSCVANSRN